MQIKLKFDSRLANRWAERFSRQRITHAARVLAPTLLALSLTTVAHAQGTMDFSGYGAPFPINPPPASEVIDGTKYGF